MTTTNSIQLQRKMIMQQTNNNSNNKQIGNPLEEMNISQATPQRTQIKKLMMMLPLTMTMMMMLIIEQKRQMLKSQR